MKNARTLFAGLALAALTAAVATPARAEEEGGGADAAVVKIGLINTLLRDTPEPLVQIMMRPFKSLLETQTGLRGEIKTSGDHDNLGRLLKDDQIQLGVFHGFEFAWAKLKEPKLQPLVICVNKVRTQHAVLVVREDSPVQKTGELQGKTLAMPRVSREHCRLFMERRCVRPGETPEKWFAGVTRAGDTEEALETVLGGTAEAAVVDLIDLEAYRKDKPGRAKQIRVLEQSTAFPNAVIACYPGRFSDARIKQFQQGMMNAGNNARGKALLELCRITRFEEVPADYEQVLANIAKEYPPLVPPK